jgi:predicted O-methyltransferase YrrM
MNSFQIGEFYRFYTSAVTKYQLHSPFVFELSGALLEDERWYYAFLDIEILRQKMISSGLAVQVLDYGAGTKDDVLFSESKRSVRSIATRAASSVRQGRMLFRLAHFLQADTILELGTSVGIGSMYLASARRESKLITLEGSPELAHIARMNLDYLGLSGVTEVREGAFEQTLPAALQELKKLDLVFLDGNHRTEPTLRYFEQCLAYAHEKTVFVLDDVHWSPGMAEAWQKIRAHPSVRLSLDFFELSLVFIDPDFREVQHLNIVPAKWKPWRFL